MTKIGGLGRLVVWGSDRGTPKYPNPFHNHRAPNHQSTICAMVKSRYIGDGHPTFNRESL